jgi:tetratricopeptide (TPR) repeat protein
MANLQGDYASARSLFEEGLTIHRELGDKESIAYDLEGLGSVVTKQGDFASARSLYEEGLTINREIGTKSGIANSLKGLGMMASLQGDYASARSLLEQSLMIHRELGDKRSIAIVIEGLASLAVKEEKALVSARLWGTTIALREAIGSPLSPYRQQAKDRDFAAIENALGQPAFTLALEEGRAMTLEQGVEYALGAIKE